MASAYDPAAWEAFCTALVGAAAALTGLLFVAVSLNLDSILKHPDFLPPRAAETLGALVAVLTSCAVTLVPQNPRLLGVELLAIALTLLAVTPRQLATRRDRADDPAAWHRARIATTATPGVPVAIAGMSLIAHWGGGLYWLAPAALLGIAAAVYSGWVLLVEIVR
jgi:modulator of FtsH protease